MYKVKGLFTVKKEVFNANEHFLKGLSYQAQTSNDGFTRVIVTDSPEYSGNPIQYVASVFGQSMARVAY